MNCPHCSKPITLALIAGGAPAVTPPPAGAPTAANLGTCPQHGRPWEYKSGNRKSDGAPYAFWACPVKDEAGFCKRKPSAGWTPPAPQAPAPEPVNDLDDLPF